MINFKKKILQESGILLFITILSPLSLLAQFNAPIKKIEPAKYIAVYSLKWQQDSTNPNFIKQEDMLLFLGEHVSKFVSKNWYNFAKYMTKICSIPRIFLNYWRTAHLQDKLNHI